MNQSLSPEELREEERYKIEKEEINILILKKAISIMKQPNNIKLKKQTQLEIELMYLLLDLK